MHLVCVAAFAYLRLSALEPQAAQLHMTQQHDGIAPQARPLPRSLPPVSPMHLSEPFVFHLLDQHQATGWVIHEQRQNQQVAWPELVCVPFCERQSGLLDVVGNVLLAKMANQLQLVPGDAAFLLALHDRAGIAPPFGSRAPLLGPGPGPEMCIGCPCCVGGEAI